MTDQETTPTPDGKVVRQAKAWRELDKAAIADRSDETRRAEFYARQQLREAVDMLEKKGPAG